MAMNMRGWWRTDVSQNWDLLMYHMIEELVTEIIQHNNICEDC
jgi:hypothetical protein